MRPMTAVAGLSNMSTDDEVQAAKDAIQDAKDAIDAANAGEAITATQATDYSRRIAMIETSLGTAEEAIAAYREKDAEDKETQRVADVADARMRAMQSYVDADADATNAEADAAEAEAASPDSPGATAARDAATAARTAANMAKDAHDAITDDMSKADADAQATEAANQAMYANSYYMTAKRPRTTRSRRLPPRVKSSSVCVTWRTPPARPTRSGHWPRELPRPRRALRRLPRVWRRTLQEMPVTTR